MILIALEEKTLKQKIVCSMDKARFQYDETSRNRMKSGKSANNYFQIQKWKVQDGAYEDFWNNSVEELTWILNSNERRQEINSVDLIDPEESSSALCNLALSFVRRSSKSAIELIETDCTPIISACPERKFTRTGLIPAHDKV